MKKLTKVIFILALLITVVLPLSARKAMTVTWQWVLSDAKVTAFRYQMNGEKDGNWIVVDGRTSSYTASGLDPYLDYTLYLQASYDGVNWSESASSIAYAVLSVDDVPHVEESVVLPYEGELTVPETKVEAPIEETTPITEEVVTATEETAPVAEETVVEPVEEETVPLLMKTVFYVYGYGIRNEWSDTYFKSETIHDGVVSSSDILSFIEYETAKYPELLSDIEYTLSDNGFVLTFEKGAYDGSWIVGQYGADLAEYIEGLFAPVEEETASIESADFTVYGYTLHNTLENTTFTSVLDDKYKNIVYKEDILAFIDYENGKYPLLEDYVSVASVENGTLVLTLPSSIDFTLFVGEYKSEIEEFITYYLSMLSKSEEKAVEVVEVAPVVEETVPEVVETPVEVEKAEVKIPGAPGSIEAKLLDGESSSLKRTFNIGLNVGTEWGFVDGSVTCFPRAAITLEGQNLLKAGRFGFGIRSDISSLLIPYSWIENGYKADLTKFFSSSKWGVDATLDMKLMTYYNLDKATFYLGVGAGYTIASEGYTPTHSLQKLFNDKFNSAVVLTGVVGLDLRIGGCAYFTLEGYSRAFLFNDVKSGTLGVSIGMNFKF